MEVLNVDSELDLVVVHFPLQKNLGGIYTKAHIHTKIYSIHTIPSVKLFTLIFVWPAANLRCGFYTKVVLMKHFIF